jgi:hypothetical protein
MVECRYGSLQRSFTLPRPADMGSIPADLDRGVSTVRLPKAMEAQPHWREILIDGELWRPPPTVCSGSGGSPRGPAP